MCLMKNIDMKKLILTAVAITVISQILHTVFAVFSMGYYTDSAYAGVWSGIMMPGYGPPPAEFYYLSAIFGLIAAGIYTAAFMKLKGAIPGKGSIRKGLHFGFWIIFLLGSVPGYLSMYLLINLPAGLLLEWAVEGLVISLISGMVITRLNGK